MSETSFKVHALELGPMENFVYLVEDVATRRCAVVDPAWDVDAIVDSAARLQLNITDILLTHSHHDHINGIEGVLNHANAEVHLLKPEYEFWQHELDKPSLHHGGDELKLGETRQRNPYRRYAVCVRLRALRSEWRQSRGYVRDAEKHETTPARRYANPPGA